MAMALYAEVNLGVAFAVAKATDVLVAFGGTGLSSGAVGVAPVGIAVHLVFTLAIISEMTGFGVADLTDAIHDGIAVRIGVGAAVVEEFDGFPFIGTRHLEGNVDELAVDNDILITWADLLKVDGTINGEGGGGVAQHSVAEVTSRPAKLVCRIDIWEDNTPGMFVCFPACFIVCQGANHGARGDIVYDAGGEVGLFFKGTNLGLGVGPVAGSAFDIPFAKLVANLLAGVGHAIGGELWAGVTAPAEVVGVGIIHAHLRVGDGWFKQFDLAAIKIMAAEAAKPRNNGIGGLVWEIQAMGHEADQHQR